MNKNALIRRFLIVLFWLGLWQLISLAVHNSILLVGPFDMIKALFSQAATADFWKSIAFSFGKISLGFLGAFISAILLAGLAYRVHFLEELLAPFMTLVTSIPVASFVILALIWIGSGMLSVFCSFLVVFPVIYVNTLAGLRSTDRQLLEMASVFDMPAWKRIHYIYRPAVFPYLVSSCKIALGMSWKSGIAAEVIGVPDYSIGERLYMSKIYLDTANLFAWTFVIIIISALFERFFLMLLKRAVGRGC
ncbi:ABC transporter permease subunit [Clostridium sp. MCC353]|uniref:ABC transporter permease n=1 Tax=Clostridium sp. MCC353 TaxID=2592646 RepID=UPI001C00CC18|nr:ABC transporter permease subunit [Clostridium sp. MCC353]MBT9775845.1 ABC transporter permease subunit [Clostridium sp. MCC353]